MSMRSSRSSSPRACSGDMYSGVPSTMPVCVSLQRLLLERVGLDGLGDAEVEHLDEVAPAAVDEEDVLGLDVAVHDAALVRRAERRGCLAHDVEHAPLGERALALEQLRQAVPLEVLHDDEGASVLGRARVGDVDDVLVADRRRQPRLLHQALRHLGAIEVLFAQHLDRHGLGQQHVRGLVHGAHAAFADLARQAVAIGQRVAHQRVDGRRLWALVVHRCFRVKKITPPARINITIAIQAQLRELRAGSSGSSSTFGGAGFLFGERSICHHRRRHLAGHAPHARVRVARRLLDPASSAPELTR